MDPSSVFGTEVMVGLANVLKSLDLLYRVWFTIQATENNLELLAFLGVKTSHVALQPHGIWTTVLVSFLTLIYLVFMIKAGQPSLPFL